LVINKYSSFKPPGFDKIDENGGYVLWVREDLPDTERTGCPRSKNIPVNPWREAFGVVFVCALLALWVKNASTSKEHKVCAFIKLRQFLPVLFFMFVAALALSHTFYAPNGLGVYGGKAKLFYFTGGIPEGFFTDNAYSTYQPAYPPGLAVLTLLSYIISGGCGEWLTQLMPVFATAVLMWVLCGNTVSAWGMLWVLAAFANGLVLHMATLYHAEPFVALFVILGWLRLRENKDDWRGWLLLGIAGLFKNEGLVVACAVWGVYAVYTTMKNMKNMKNMKSMKKLPMSLLSMSKYFLLVAALPVAWHVSCRLAGATLYDYAPVWEPDWAKFAAASEHILKTVFYKPWRYGFAYPLAVLAPVLLLSANRKEYKPVLAASLTMLLCMPAFAYVYSLSRSPFFEWHLGSSAARLLWVPSLPVICEILRLKVKFKEDGRDKSNLTFYGDL